MPRVHPDGSVAAGTDVRWAEDLRQRRVLAHATRRLEAAGRLGRRCAPGPFTAVGVGSLPAAGIRDSNLTSGAVVRLLCQRRAGERLHSAGAGQPLPSEDATASEWSTDAMAPGQSVYAVVSLTGWSQRPLDTQRSVAGRPRLRAVEVRAPARVAAGVPR